MAIYERESQQKCWDFYLHKIDGKSFDEFMHGVKGKSVPREKPKTILKSECKAMMQKNIRKFGDMRFCIGEEI